MEFDPTKPVRTRDGREARIITFGADNKLYPIVALVKSREGAEYPVSVTEDGLYCDEWDSYDDDLVNVPAPKQKAELWVNVYPDNEFGKLCHSKELADQSARRQGPPFRIAYVKVNVEYSEGEGLD